MALPEHLQNIRDKIKRGEVLTREEDLTYFTEVMGYSLQEAERILAIVDNEEITYLLD